MIETLKISAIAAAVFAYANIQFGIEFRERFVIGMRTQFAVDAIKNNPDFAECSWPYPSVTTNYTCSSAAIKTQLDKAAKTNETRTRSENPFTGMDYLRWGVVGALVGLSLPFHPDCGNDDEKEVTLPEIRITRAIETEVKDIIELSKAEFETSPRDEEIFDDASFYPKDQSAHRPFGRGW